MNLDELLDPALRSRLDALARRAKRPPAALAAEMLAASISDTEALLDALRESAAQADRGEVMNLDEYATRMKAHTSRR
jgi:predicted transcriptional regulator